MQVYTLPKRRTNLCLSLPLSLLAGCASYTAPLEEITSFVFRCVSHSGSSIFFATSEGYRRGYAGSS